MDKLTVKQLKAELSAVELKQTGLKAVLKARLLEHLENLGDGGLHPFSLPTSCPACGGRVVGEGEMTATVEMTRMVGVDALRGEAGCTEARGDTVEALMATQSKQMDAHMAGKGADDEGEGPRRYCVNTMGCRPQVLWRLQHFASKQGLNLKGLGPASIETLYEAGLVRLPSDILDLADNTEGLAGLGKGWGAKSAARVANEVSRVLEEGAPLHAVINAMSIRHVGDISSRLIADYFDGDGDRWIEAMENPSPSGNTGISSGVKGIGFSAEGALTTFFALPLHRDMARDVVSRLCRRQVKKSGDGGDGGSRTRSEGALAGLRICFTGKLARMTRDEAEETARGLGGVVTRTVSAKTTVLVVGAGGGDKNGVGEMGKKEAAARSNGSTCVVTEEEWEWTNDAGFSWEWWQRRGLGAEDGT